MVFTPGIDIGIGLLLAIVFLKYSGYTIYIKRALAFVIAGIMFLFVNEAWILWTEGYPVIAATLTYVWQIVAFILIFIGAIWAVVDLVRVKK